MLNEGVEEAGRTSALKRTVHDLSPMMADYITLVDAESLSVVIHAGPNKC